MEALLTDLTQLCVLFLPFPTVTAYPDVGETEQWVSFSHRTDSLLTSWQWRRVILAVPLPRKGTNGPSHGLEQELNVSTAIDVMILPLLVIFVEYKF